jgi:hypothetical protein
METEMLIAIVIFIVVLVIAWELLRRFSCLNCLVGLVCLGIGVALLFWAGLISLPLEF